MRAVLRLTMITTVLYYIINHLVPPTHLLPTFVQHILRDAMVIGHNCRHTPAEPRRSAITEHSRNAAGVPSSAGCMPKLQLERMCYECMGVPIAPLWCRVIAWDTAKNDVETVE